MSHYFRISCPQAALLLARRVKPRPQRGSSPAASTGARREPTTGDNMINWKALDNVPVLLYILALKTLLLCLAFAGVKIYQSRRAEEQLKRQQEQRRRLAQQTQELLDHPKED
ncbi:small integral membrane protein 11-like [Antennarius striatus]|uniref:small integral membrane protein 11-like n=1 Tax=Antennarius striatus TaxID=241820 RepID=UPI0035AF7538